MLDWDAIDAAEPTWLVGLSDISTLMTPLTLSDVIGSPSGGVPAFARAHPPERLLVNGALGRLRWVGDERTLTQTFAP